MCNNQYLCDPPYGFVSESKGNPTSKEQNKSVSLIDIIIDIFLGLFHKIDHFAS